MLTILIIVLLMVLLLGAFPAHGYNRDWGYGPVGLLATVIIVVVVLMLVGVL